MGILENLMGKSDEQTVAPGFPFKLSTNLRPVRLAAKKDNCLELLVAIKNLSDKPYIASASLELPKSLGFENLGITKIKEIRMGELDIGKEKTISFSVCASFQTAPGVYSAVLTLNQHYKDYAHVLNYAKKNVEIRVV